MYKWTPAARFCYVITSRRKRQRTDEKKKKKKRRKKKEERRRYPPAPSAADLCKTEEALRKKRSVAHGAPDTDQPPADGQQRAGGEDRDR